MQQDFIRICERRLPGEEMLCVMTWIERWRIEKGGLRKTLRTAAKNCNQLEKDDILPARATRNVYL